MDKAKGGLDQKWFPLEQKAKVKRGDSPMGENGSNGVVEWIESKKCGGSKFISKVNFVSIKPFLMMNRATLTRRKESELNR